LGYALAADDMHTQGDVVDYRATFATTSSKEVQTSLNSWVGAQTGLASLTWAFSQRADIRVRYFVLNDERDLSASLNAPTDPTQQYPGGQFVGPGPALGSQNLNALLVTARAPLASGSLTASYASSGTSVVYAGGGTSSPYEISNNDKLGTFTFGWERSAAGLDLAVGGYTRNETLAEPEVFSNLQTQHSQALYVRTGFTVGPRLHLQANGYDTAYSTFGASLDGRLGAVYDFDARSNVRFSVGTGFRAPLLAELYTAPYPVLLATINADCVAPNGNPNEKPEHVTTYELGYGRQMGEQTTLDATLYRTNLRQPIELFYPLDARCPPPPAPPVVAGELIPVNISNAVYEGGTLRLAHRFGNFFAKAEYGINVAYPDRLPEAVANPTSGANLVSFQQFQGIPIQNGTLSVGYAHAGFYGNAAATYRGKNNELNAGPYAIVSVALGKRAHDVDYWIAARNLTNAVSGQFTQLGQGVPYPTPEGPLGTNLYVNQPLTVSAGITLRR
jgi:outer membrane receptor protein involved in Fe transport